MATCACRLSAGQKRGWVVSSLHKKQQILCSVRKPVLKGQGRERQGRIPNNLLGPPHVCTGTHNCTYMYIYIYTSPPHTHTALRTSVNRLQSLAPSNSNMLIVQYYSKMCTFPLFFVSKCPVTWLYCSLIADWNLRGI